jgi:putative nucleotidyltransferase with HDIG domain
MMIMTSRSWFYFTLVLAGAGLFLVLVDWTVLFDLTIRDYSGLAVFVGLAAFSEYLAVESGRSHRVRSSIAFLPLLAAALVFPVSAVLICVTLMYLATPVQDRKWHILLFNLAQGFLAYGFAATIFQLLSSGPSLDGGLQNFLDLFFPFYVAAFSFFAINVLLVSAYIAIRDDQELFHVISEATGRGGGNVMYDLLASPIALLVAYLYWTFYIPGLLAVVLPLLLIRFTYLSALQLDRANHDLLRVLIKAIETRDPYTSGHSLRVSTLARLIAEDHGLRSTIIKRIEKAALLHDIGKIDAAYANIISKSSGLSTEEFALIKTHATKGAQLLQTLTSLEKDVVEGVRHHHEQYDGSGYPDGLSGKAIPLAARIIMLCDSIDAMLSDRPYRDALNLADVKDELRSCSGSQFDPDLIETILNNNTLERAELLVERAGARTLVRAVAG